MFKRFFLLVTIIAIFSCNSTQKYYTDVKEYGFKAKVKRVVTKHYEGLAKYNHWLVNENNLVYVTTMNIDTVGNIITIVDSSATTLYKPFYRKYVYEHKDNLISGYKVYDLKGELIGASTVEWKSKYKYLAESFFKIPSKYTVNAYTELDNNFRQRKGGYIMKFENNKIMIRHYIKKFKNNGAIDYVTKIDTIIDYAAQTTKEFRVILEDAVYDAHHNLIQFALVKSESGELIEYISRTIDYYE
jgi:hypothetical protein